MDRFLVSILPARRRFSSNSTKLVRSEFTCVHIGFSRIVFQKPEEVLSPERKDIPVLFSSAFCSWFLNTYPVHSFCGTFVLCHMHKVEGTHWPRWVLYNVRVEWRRSCPCRDSFQISSRNHHQLLLYRENHRWSGRYLLAFHYAFVDFFQLRRQNWLLNRVH